MPKSLFIAEKPSVAAEFAKALGEPMSRRDGYQESETYVVTWCVGHLVSMSYPEVYDPALKKWSVNTLPFLPDHFLYEVIPGVKKQFQIVSGLLNRPDVDTIYVCTDSGREGEYIYRLVEQMAGVKGKTRKRVWIDSQTEEEIHRGIREAKDLSAYDNLAASAYLRAKEDYLMGINFSRVLTLKYGNSIASYLGQRYAVVSVGRVMTCVLGMVVRREREIRSFVKKPFFRVLQSITLEGRNLEGEFRAVEGSDYFGSPKLYRENGFVRREDAQAMIDSLLPAYETVVDKIEKKKENKNPPLLYNLAELQNDCSRMFKISPDETLRIVQELYEKKLVTYPRTDARVLSSAVAKEIDRNLRGLTRFTPAAAFAQEVLNGTAWKNIGKTRYTNDKQITDHYAIIPTGQGLNALGSLKGHANGVYQAIVRRFLSIFYPPAQFRKISMVTMLGKERFFYNFRILTEEGYFKVAGNPYDRSRRTSGSQNEPASSAAPGSGPFGNASTVSQNAADPSGNASTVSQNAAGPSGNTSTVSQNAADPSGYASTVLQDAAGQTKDGDQDGSAAEQNAEVSLGNDPQLLAALEKLRKGTKLPLNGLSIKEGETSPPKRYTSGSMILAMENAGQLIEDEELRAQIKGSGIGTSATRAEILKKLVSNNYLALNKKTQVLTPTLMGEMIHDVVYCSIRSLLNPELTASWEKGLTYVAEGTITDDAYMEKLTDFVRKRTDGVKHLNNQTVIRPLFDEAAKYYKPTKKKEKENGKG